MNMRLKNKSLLAIFSLLVLTSCSNIATSNNSAELSNGPEIIVAKALQGTTRELSTTAYTTLFDQVIKGVVSFVNYQSDISKTMVAAGIGSGFIYSEDTTYYYLITNRHVVEDYDEMQIITHTNQEIKVDIIGEDTTQDVAVARVEKSKVKDVIVCDLYQENGVFYQPEVGEAVFAIGNPGSLTFRKTLTTGIIAGLDRVIQETDQKTIMIETHATQLDIAINPGNSGGPLFNMDGKIIGVNSLKIVSDGVNDVEGVNFALPIHDMYYMAESLKTYYQTNHRVKSNTQNERFSLGIKKAESMIDVSLEERKEANIPGSVYSGVYVKEVLDSNMSGLVDAVIVGFNETPIENKAQLRRCLLEYDAEESVTIQAYYPVNGTYPTTAENQTFTLVKEMVGE